MRLHGHIDGNQLGQATLVILELLAPDGPSYSVAAVTTMTAECTYELRFDTPKSPVHFYEDPRPFFLRVSCATRDGIVEQTQQQLPQSVITESALFNIKLGPSKSLTTFSYFGSPPLGPDLNSGPSRETSVALIAGLTGLDEPNLRGNIRVIRNSDQRTIAGATVDRLGQFWLSLLRKHTSEPMTLEVRLQSGSESVYRSIIRWPKHKPVWRLTVNCASATGHCRTTEGLVLRLSSTNQLKKFASVLEFEILVSQWTSLPRVGRVDLVQLVLRADTAVEWPLAKQLLTGTAGQTA